jgi:TRAP-type mannitol/chloroaromatic compound transport system permease large subunit
LLPGLVLTGMYVAYVALVAIFRPSFAGDAARGAHAARARRRSGCARCGADVVAVAGAWLFASQVYRADAPRDELVVVSPWSASASPS